MPIVLLLLMPILIKAPLLLGALQADTMASYSGLQINTRPGPLTSYPTIDPNVGFTSQALGRHAALELLAGRMPWWNTYEGVGVPLAGNMQSASLFPPTLLLALRNGQLYEHILLQMLTAAATYALLRRLALGRLPAFSGATCFAFNGTFAWLANAVINPVPFLPLLLFGIEMAVTRPGERRLGGVSWIALALCGSLYAGFPETAYLDGLLAAAWTLGRVVTLPGSQRRQFIAAVALAGVTGLLLAAPILIAFFDYLRVGDVFNHVQGGLLGQHLPSAYLASTAVPYLFGNLFQAPQASQFWSGVGGYAGCSLLVLAFAGLVSPCRRKLRCLLGVWVVGSISVSFGAGWLLRAVELLPGLDRVALYRYLAPSWTLALCVLAALALNDTLKDRRRWPLGLGVAALLVGIGAALTSMPPDTAPILRGALSRASVAMAVASLALMLYLNWRPWPRPSSRAACLAVVLILETLSWFVLPLLAFPRRASAELAGIAFLRSHLGLQRFATLGPIAPNYGSYFSLPSVNHNDEPVPRNWASYVKKNLDENVPSIVFNGDMRMTGTSPTATEELLLHETAFAQTGVRYVVTRLAQTLPLPEVFADRVLRVYELTNEEPYFVARNCRLDVRDRRHLQSNCDAASTLTRLELAMPGWQARVNGRGVDVHEAGIFQSISLPAGEASVAFAFEPPWMIYGYVSFALGLVVLVVNELSRAHQRVATPKLVTGVGFC